MATVQEQAEFWLTAIGCDKSDVQTQTLGPATLRNFGTCADGKVLQHVFDTELGHTWAAKYDEPVLSFFLSLK